MTYKVNTKRELESGAEPDPSGGVNTQSTVRFGSDVDVFTGSSWAWAGVDGRVDKHRTLTHVTKIIRELF